MRREKSSLRLAEEGPAIEPSAFLFEAISRRYGVLSLLRVHTWKRLAKFQEVEEAEISHFQMPIKIRHFSRTEKESYSDSQLHQVRIGIHKYGINMPSYVESRQINYKFNMPIRY